MFRIRQALIDRLPGLSRVSGLEDTAAGIVRHQHWHPEQSLEETEQGLVLTLPVTDDREVLMKVLQFGSQACILEPGSLRRKAKDETKKMSRLYKKGTDDF